MNRKIVSQSITINVVANSDIWSSNRKESKMPSEGSGEGSKTERRNNNREQKGKNVNGSGEWNTLYWELSSSLSSGISPFLVVEKYLESFLLIFSQFARFSFLFPVSVQLLRLANNAMHNQYLDRLTVLAQIQNGVVFYPLFVVKFPNSYHGMSE